MPTPLPNGLYDVLVSESIAAALSDLPDPARTVEAILGPDTPEQLAEALTRQLVLVLDEMDGGIPEKARKQLDLINSLLAALRARAGDAALAFDPLSAPPRVLRAVHRTPPPLIPPETGLSVPWLFTAGKGTPSLLSELRRELAGCDQVDVLVSFITVSGVRKLLDVLETLTSMGADGCPTVRVRILTTTYTGATEARALDLLARLPGCEVKISLDGRRTRLHAKAWIFHRSTGFGSAYVGSANLSGAALLGGLEWTVKFTERGQIPLFERAKAHFETLWNDGEFQAYDAENAEHRAALQQALRREAGETLIASPTFFDIQPKPYQLEMLDQLEMERQCGRRRNLIVAATGTGKTIVAAFDYRRTCEERGGRPRLLFVAHRDEILRQALRTYREVLRDHSFGDLLAGGSEPASYDHVFGVIDSVTSRGLVNRFGSGHWHSVVVDECHRLAAERFHEFVTDIRPHLLLGLTATPERSDGKSILPYFDNRADGSPAVELRLWHALELQLLCSFEYFGCDDETDFSEVPWDRPGESAAVDRAVTGNDIRARLVIDEWRRLVSDAGKSRAVAFCVSVAHAEFMARKFNEAGLPAQCVVGSTPTDERRKAPERLARGELCVLVTCDLYNEGVDLPSVDTLLLLRPTQSPVLFQQQIGRGLRLAPGKESCVVLDFVGRHRQEFRFDRLLATLTGQSRAELIDSVENGFSRLPPGCHIQLGKVTRSQVLNNLRAMVQQSWRRLRAELQAYSVIRGRANVRLADFLREQSVDLGELYRGSGRSGWTNLKRDAGLVSGGPSPEDEYFGRRFSDLLHIDDPDQCRLMGHLGEAPANYEAFTDPEKRRLQMLAYQVDGQSRQVGSGEAFLKRLGQNPEILVELRELGSLLQSRGRVPARSVPGLEDTPLCLHANYGRREILTAVGRWTSSRRPSFFEGVLRLQDRKMELLFVTLDKSEGFHDRIAYRDYAICSDQFHWQSQNTAGRNTEAGKRYLASSSNGWRFQLFVRPKKGDPYRACGPVTVDQVSGDRPMNIVWRLGVPLPVRLFESFSVLRAA